MFFALATSSDEVHWVRKSYVSGIHLIGSTEIGYPEIGSVEIGSAEVSLLTGSAGTSTAANRVLAPTNWDAALGRFEIALLSVRDALNRFHRGFLMGKSNAITAPTLQNRCISLPIYVARIVLILHSPENGRSKMTALPTLYKV